MTHKGPDMDISEEIRRDEAADEMDALRTEIERLRAENEGLRKLNTESLEEAVARVKGELPGWWWSVCECSVSADATLAPDRTGPDADLLEHRIFDNGIAVDLPQPATAAEALLEALDRAKAVRASYRL